MHRVINIDFNYCLHAIPAKHNEHLFRNFANGWGLPAGTTDMLSLAKRKDFQHLVMPINQAQPREESLHNIKLVKFIREQTHERTDDRNFHETKAA